MDSPSLPYTYELHVAEPQPVVPRSHIHDGRLIAAETLSYSGLWLEEELSREAICDAHHLASRLDLSVIGAVIPRNAHETGRLLQTSGFRKVGAFHWWTFNLKSD